MPARRPEERAAIVLAGGSGTRLNSVTESILGRVVPKQFCPLFGDDTMLARTLRRVALTIDERRTVTVVTRAHQEFYKSQLANASGKGLIVQPRDQGTAPAILYALLRMTNSSRSGAAAIFPSDHYVSNDLRFMLHVEAAFESLKAFPELVVLLGIRPESPEVQYGWIEPGEPLFRTWFSLHHLRRIRRFCEKPSDSVAQKLYRQGCLWNSFVVVAKIQTLLALYRRTLPHLYKSFIAIRPTLGTPFEEKAADFLYDRLSPTSFPNSILVNCFSGMAVLPVSGLEWSDLGTPERLMAVLERLGVESKPLAKHAIPMLREIKEGATAEITTASDSLERMKIASSQ